MNRRCLVAAVVVAACAVPSAFAQAVKTRDLVRIKAELGNPKKVVALDYEVLLTKPDGTEAAINPEEHKFALGDRIRVRIRPASAMYAYIFHEGASGNKLCLLPREGEKAPYCQAGETLELPDDGTVFQFSAPPGREKLIVVATDQEVTDLQSLAGTAFQGAPGTREEKILDSIKNDADRPVIKTRGILSADGLKTARSQVETRRSKQLTIVDPAGAGNSSTFAGTFSFDDSKRTDLFLEIPLTSASAP